ncbi:redoxin domain-containing protein [Phenylobacterium sp.]|jgi:mono/diheme cytochrome c family protein|uniref:redoxin domain-containing protein n=1 Tax=Phenylobacterium sp. TaxID=1871053 RepID=UPI002E2F19E8|nr:redoxin domain-containing protein [Phenylobacterium sp.]HEX4709407.1 redoxin domain-containing protein [Phenylobacterium sp.]
MMSARIGVLGAAVGALLVYGCSSTEAVNALTTGQSASATETMAAAATPATIDNFMLVDAQKLEAHELYRMADDKAIVLVSTGNGCPIARAMMPALKALRDKYAAQGVEVMLVDSNLQDSRDAIAAEAKEYGIDIPILMDSNQLVGEALGVTRTAEVFVITPKTWQVAYRGPLDDRSDYGVQKAATKEFANDALAAVLAGKPAPAASQASKGCLVDFPERAKAAQHAKISYTKDVAPILEAKCVACHQEGGIGPFAMTNYQMVKGFSPMIREVIRTDRMPPYNADPHVGKFSDDKNLSPAEIKTLVHWIEAGSPRGDGVDPLGAVHHVDPEWPLGKPDLVLNVPAYKIPASGVVDYQHPYVVNPETEGKWLRASTVKVEQRQGVHHILTGFMKEVPAPGQPAFENKWGVSVGGYAVGAESEIAPKNVGTYIPPGGAIGIQAHYTPFGKEVTDHSQIALYFYKDNEKPGLVMHNSVIVNNAIVIPPNDPHHQEVGYITFPHDALLYAAFPHAHYRGASSDLWIRYPDGKEKLLLSLPRYDFSWQRDYTFAEPIKVPAGSKLIAHFIYDNSKRNPNNPDPSKTVVWGDQSWEEMFYTAIRYRWTDETSDKMNNYDEALNNDRLMGMLDSNIDGKIEKSELKGQIGEQIGKYFDVLDKNHDGALDKTELAAMQQMMGSQHRRREAAATDAKPAAPAAAPAGSPSAGK